MERFWKWIFIAFILALMAWLLSGCGSMERIGRHGLYGSPNGTWSGDRFPPPQAGLFIEENPNPAVWAETFLLQGYFSRRSVFTYDPARRIVFVVKPIAYFCISPPISRGSGNNVPALRSFAYTILPPYPAGYTLVVFHRNFWWQMVGRPEVKHFRINGDPFDDEFTLNGRKVMCDRYIKLGSRNAYEKTYFRLRFEIDLKNYVPW